MAMDGKREKMRQARKNFITLIVFVMLCIAFFPGTAKAQDLVSGKYISSSGTSIVLELTIQVRRQQIAGDER